MLLYGDFAKYSVILVAVLEDELADHCNVKLNDVVAVVSIVAVELVEIATTVPVTSSVAPLFRINMASPDIVPDEPIVLTVAVNSTFHDRLDELFAVATVPKSITRTPDTVPYLTLKFAVGVPVVESMPPHSALMLFPTAMVLAGIEKPPVNAVSAFVDAIALELLVATSPFPRAAKFAIKERSP